MSKLTKEETISALEAAILNHEGRKVAIEQKGSWYKIDGGKSLRFGELESMLESFNSGSSSDSVKTKPVAEAKPKNKTAPIVQKMTSKKTKSTIVGKLPKELWLERLTTIGGTFTLPRGF
ncbi:hypothetical protein D5R81_04140 [Parashewanella spongiae]|uniref:Uncharacterized protein n=1 Tax=Parashewanella spongiae TaxID=342950 RepID=A0A3A6ULV7_9GAMM|nr:hypothetical protein [Parashewanella spongiae]MCL1077231.1 hypothetical protein [Parashewanella spongiae]RJY18690.1 hypothetical protein D5R81_04140 [Parashewanella spongiae]